MAIVAVPITSKASLVLNKGQDPDTGKTISGSCSITGLVAGPDNTKLYNVASLLAECVAYPVVKVTKTETDELSNE